MQLESSEGLDSTSTYPKWNLTFHFSKFILCRWYYSEHLVL